MASGRSVSGKALSEQEMREIVREGIPPGLVQGRRLLVLTPDATRTCPLPLMARILAEEIGTRASRLDFMVALGTHTPLNEDGMDALFGTNRADREKVFRGARFLNHRWDLPGELRNIGAISAPEVERLTGGLFSERVDITINRAIFEYDRILILGPVFPHEVVGFSGGNKYLFPGISGGDFLHFFHWLSAVITSPKVIGFKRTPVRDLVDRAAAMVSVPRWCLAMVVDPSGGLAGLYAGAPEDAWAKAADHSANVHVVYKEKPFHTVVGVAPAMYDELWTAGKVMYKLEPVVADRGTLYIYAPHLREISRTWGGQIERIGYHVRDWFLAHGETFRDVPRGVIAHSTQVRGIGTYEGGVERPRIDVVLATGIPEETCRRIGLGYRDPRIMSLEEYRGREREGILLVERAGEVLHRLSCARGDA